MKGWILTSLSIGLTWIALTVTVLLIVPAVLAFIAGLILLFDEPIDEDEWNY
jgi:apolipoprotein N-acyltransferase